MPFYLSKSALLSNKSALFDHSHPALFLKKREHYRYHRARVTQRLLQQFQWDIFKHPPYSLDLAPSDFHFFPELKQWLEGKCFQTGIELQKPSKFTSNHWWLHFIKRVLQSLLHDKCLDRQDDYAEK